jgi:glycosyltransferase involved in cell wall biosynthesis
MSMAQKISACWIVKNEAIFLASSLASVAGVADEILVGDTGSTDESVDIAQNAGARVVKIPWNGSYADARNAVMAHATGSWILFLDGDELLEPSHGALIRESDISLPTM